MAEARVVDEEVKVRKSVVVYVSKSGVEGMHRTAPVYVIWRWEHTLHGLRLGRILQGGRIRPIWGRASEEIFRSSSFTGRICA